MTPEELAAIRERDAALDRHQEHRRNTGLGEMRPLTGDLDRHALLAHIDAITEDNERLRGLVMVYQPVYEAVRDSADPAVVSVMVGLLRGTPQR